MSKYRSRLEIIADVLAVVSGSAKKTQIMYQANLSYKLLTRYLKDVMDMGLVRMENGNTYELTEKGSDFLKEFKDYHGRRVEVEEKLSKVEDEKVTLENRFLNSEIVDAGLKDCLNKKDEKQRAE